MRVVTKMAIALLMVWPAVAGADPICPIGAPPAARPSSSDVVGNPAGSPGGCFARPGGQLLRFDLGGRLANRVHVTNTTPDRPGVDDIAALTLVDAAAAVTPEPASMLLLGTGLIVLAGTIRRSGRLRPR